MTRTMRISVEVEARHAEALRLIARKEHRPVLQYVRDALFFLVRDRAAVDEEVRALVPELAAAAQAEGTP